MVLFGAPFTWKIIVSLMEMASILFLRDGLDYRLTIYPPLPHSPKETLKSFPGSCSLALHDVLDRKENKT